VLSNGGRLICVTGSGAFSDAVGGAGTDDLDRNNDSPGMVGRDPIIQFCLSQLGYALPLANL